MLVVAETFADFTSRGADVRNLSFFNVARNGGKAPLVRFLRETSEFSNCVSAMDGVTLPRCDL